jgi:hypothetical protein
MRRGELDAAVSDFQRARFLARRDGDRTTEFLAMEHLAQLELSRRRFAEAGIIATDMIALANRMAPGSEGPFAATLAGLCRLAAGNAGADAGFEAALTTLRHADAKHRLAFVLSIAAAVDLDRGRLAEGRTRAEESLALAVAINSPSHIALAEAIVAEAGARSSSALATAA